MKGSMLLTCLPIPRSAKKLLVFSAFSDSERFEEDLMAKVKNYTEISLNKWSNF